MKKNRGIAAFLAFLVLIGASCLTSCQNTRSANENSSPGGHGGYGGHGGSH